ncbi:MAG: VIT domain-containing protein [Kofleriaceae bacterium]
MSASCDHITDDLADLVANDAAAIARHADHLATCDHCRDARHDAAELASALAHAGSDHAAANGDQLAERLLARLDADVVVPAPAPVVVAPAQPSKAAVTPIASRRRNRLWLTLGASAAVAAGAAAILSLNGRTAPAASVATSDGSIGRVGKLERAAADKAGGLEIKDASGWRALAADAALPAGAELRTDARTRTRLELSDGSRLVLDHETSIAFDKRDPRKLTLTSGRVSSDFAHDDKHSASVRTPAGLVEVVGTRFVTTATDKLTSVQVVRGKVILSTAAGQRADVRAGEEGSIENGQLAVSSAPSLASSVAWSELAPPAAPGAEAITAGLGALRAYKPGEKRDRDWNLALAKHDVKVRISGPIARTEITETFRNDTDTTLEGVYQFPLPPDAQIDNLELDIEGGFMAGAFLDKERAGKIWKGVIDKATPKIASRPSEDIIWVQGPWRDPALLDWKRGGRFELRIYPIPAKGARTIKIAYTQVVTPRGAGRQYIYPLPHSQDGSTVADQLTVDVEVRGAQQGGVRAVGYALAPDPKRTDVNAMTFTQSGFVPRGDLVVDYKSVDGAAELRAWTFTGGAATGPDEQLAKKQKVGIDPKVVEAQRQVAGDARPTAVLALRPKLPRWDETKARDYMIVVDASQSMVGERYARAGKLVAALVDQMDRRDRFSVMTCDSECRKLGDLRGAGAKALTEVGIWLGAQQPAGASDIVASIRAAGAELGSADRERWVLFVGDGFASTGFRKSADVERAIADTSKATKVHVTTIGIGGDADSTVLGAVARGGGGSYLAWVPGQTVGTAALAVLESTNGTTLRDATITLPTGLADVAPTVLPTIRAGEEILVAARMTGEVTGDVTVKGIVAGQPFEQRYPLKLAVSSSAGNGFVPRLWASLAIDQLERQGRGEDRARIVALSQGYGVMSRETSLLVLESQAMFDAFGVDRSSPRATWTGEEAIEEVAAAGQVNYDPAPNSGPLAKSKAPSAPMKDASKADDESDLAAPGDARDARVGSGRAAKADAPMMRSRRPGMIAMRRVWYRVAAVSSFDGVNAAIRKSITDAEAALAASPDARERHRALVQALSYAGEIDRAREIAKRWLDRDQLDPQALGYEADLLGRDGHRDVALRTLSGLVDLEADRVALHERMVRTYETAGRMAQACSHRIAIAGLQPKLASSSGEAIRCLRALGRESDAELVSRGMIDDASRAAAEKAATVAPIAPKANGDFVVDGRWDHNADLDISVIAPDGTRVSWMGGRKDVVVADSTSTTRERLAIRSLKRGNYLVEISRADTSTGPIRGTLDVTVLGVKRAIPFELATTRTVAGRVAVSMQSRLERAW